MAVLTTLPTVTMLAAMAAFAEALVLPAAHSPSTPSGSQLALAPRYTSRYSSGYSNSRSSSSHTVTIVVPISIFLTILLLLLLYYAYTRYKRRPRPVTSMQGQANRNGPISAPFELDLEYSSNTVAKPPAALPPYSSSWPQQAYPPPVQQAYPPPVQQAYPYQGQQGPTYPQMY